MRRARIALILSAGVLLGSIAAIGRIPSPHDSVPQFLALYAVAFAAYLVAVRVTHTVAVTPVVLVVVCALAHAVVVPARPDLSTDIYRYAWEGRIMHDGHNPFSAPPADSTFVALRDSDYAHISHQALPTIYPPLAQAVFYLAASVQPGPIALKVVFSLFNLGTLWVLFRMLRRRSIPPSRALLFAWNPLVILETAHSGHVDAMAAFFLVLALDLWESKRRAWAGLVLGASVLVKYLAVAAVPWLARRRHVAVLAVMALIVLAGYVPFMGAGTKLFASLRVYSENWWFNGPPFIALSGFLGDATIARRLLAAGGIAFALAAASRERDLVRYVFLVVGAALVVSPTVYPWYLMWIMPLVCVFPHRAWIGFSGLVMLSYGVWDVFNQSGEWFVPTWLLALEYVPFYLLLLAGLSRGKNRAWATA
jgi:alpha-1,6-mannosyltransferase